MLTYSAPPFRWSGGALQGRGRDGAVHHLTERKARLQAGDPWQTRQLGAVDLLEVLEVPRAHRDKVVVASRHQEAAHHGRTLGNRLFKGVQGLLALRSEEHTSELQS